MKNLADRFRVLVTDRFDVDAYARLTSDPQIELKKSESPRPTNEELAWAQGLVFRSRTVIDFELLAHAPDLRVAVTATSGFDHVDFEAIASRKDLAVMHTPEANAASAAELTWALVLGCARRIPDAHRAAKAGDWRREALTGSQLSGKTYGVIGLGRIGSRVAKMASAFGMRVFAFDPYKDDSRFAESGATRTSLEEIFKLADVISAHVPSTPETHHMINRSHLESDEKDELIFVNTSRGSLIEETLLVEALVNGWITACGLDVFEREPLPRQSKLNQLPNVVLSPHLGATTREAFRAASLEAADRSGFGSAIRRPGPRRAGLR